MGHLENANIHDTKKYFLLFNFLYYRQESNFKILFQVNECQGKEFVKDFLYNEKKIQRKKD